MVRKPSKISPRRYTSTDQLWIHLDQAVRTLFGRPPTTGRVNPASGTPEVALESNEQRRSQRLMRVNHTGEVCAQALYQGQSLTAKSASVRQCLQQAAAEENDHLLWCEQRIRELGGRTSVLNPLFYGSSLLIGAVNGRRGDAWNLGFVMETEQQVVQHLDDHLTRLSPKDLRSRAVLETMKEDEHHHGTTALGAGGVQLPLPVRLVMKGVSKVMTRSTYWG